MRIAIIYTELKIMNKNRVLYITVSSTIIVESLYSSCTIRNWNDQFKTAGFTVCVSRV